MIDYSFGVKLGPLSDIESDVLRAWRNDKNIYQWCRQFEPLEAWTHEAWLKSLPSRSDIKMYLIHADDQVVGVCGLTSIDMINRRAEFSLYIAKDYHGHGYGKKALLTLCQHGFWALGLNSIFGETFEGNLAARTFEDIGFQKEGTRRQFYYRSGQFIDAHLYSILRWEFEKKWNSSLPLS